MLHKSNFRSRVKGTYSRLLTLVSIETAYCELEIRSVERGMERGMYLPHSQSTVTELFL